MLINIDIPGNSYSVRVGETLDNFGMRLREFTQCKKICVITNDTIGSLYRDRIAASFQKAGFDILVLRIKDGEKYKTPSTVSELHNRMCEEKIERFTPVVAFGGGVVGDVAGYVASTYLRGLPFYNIPTSLVAQVDSAIGGKTGVNLPGGKNLVGTFYQPAYVHVDIELLKTLEKPEFVSALSEVIKSAVIKGEKFLTYIEENIKSILKLDEDILEVVVTECVKIKGGIVARDEKEKGLRQVLNLGHTLGHALEVVCGYGQMRHGDAVAIGMLFDSMLAVKKSVGSPLLTDRLKKLLTFCHLPTRIPAYVSEDDLIKVMYVDKKVRGGNLKFVLPIKPGEVMQDVVIEEKMVRETVRKLKIKNQNAK